MAHVKDVMGGRMETIRQCVEFIDEILFSNGLIKEGHGEGRKVCHLLHEIKDNIESVETLLDSSGEDHDRKAVQ